MKKLFSIALVAIFAFAMNVKAQSPLVATLNHEGTISVFYGADAFVNAHNAAEHGDAITLSSGSFMSTDITKAVSIHGAGMLVDSITNLQPTILLKDFNIEVPDTTDHRLLLEGIYHDGDMNLRFSRNAQLLKCRIKEIGYTHESGQRPIDISFVHCRIQELGMNGGSSANFTNCIVDKKGYIDNEVPLIFTNCFLGFASIGYADCRNCVLISGTNGGGYAGGSNSVYNNCILISTNTGEHLGANQYNKTISIEDAGDLVGEYSDMKTYELPENVKNLIKGTDGTEVGIYGGSFPYDPTPSNPQITKFTVDKKSSADGKLNVVVEINGAK